MAKELTYERSTSTVLKAVGVLNLDTGVIEFETESKRIGDLLADFDDMNVELCCKVKTKEDLELGECTDSDEE